MATRFAPNLYVSDVERSSRFYTGIGFHELERMNLPDGTVVWAMLQREGNRIFLERAEPGTRLAASVLFYLAVDDLDTEMRRLAEAQVAVVGPMHRTYGMKEVSFRDPDGYDWTAGQRIAAR